MTSIVQDKYHKKVPWVPETFLARSFGLRPKMCRPSANTENSDRISSCQGKGSSSVTNSRNHFRHCFSYRSTIIIFVAVGPTNFPLDRLMAIFYSIVEDNVAPSASILCQISFLVSLNLLAQVTSDDQIDCPKYKCLVNFLTISEIVKQLKFDIVQYLYDFV